MDHQKVPMDLTDIPVLDDAPCTAMHAASEPSLPSPSFAMHKDITLGLDFKAAENFAK
jgi:hypothetical protein